MTSKSNIVDWGGLTLRVNEIEYGTTGPHKADGTELSVKHGPVVIPDDTTYAVLAANSGLIHVVPDLTADCTITLPAAAAGLAFEFWGGAAAADAQNWIFVPTAGFFIGGLLHADVGGTTAALYSDGNSNDVFTVVTPAAGTNIKFVSDGTNWYVNGTLSSATIGTMADT
jgi:hypothetical protein